MIEPTVDKKEIIKILIVGGQSVGKSTIVSRIIGTEFKNDYTPTTGYNINSYKFQTSSGLNGVYSFPEPLGTYTVKIDTTGAPFTIQCANPGIDSTVTTTALSPLQSNINFNITCKPGFDLGVQSIYHQ